MATAPAVPIPQINPSLYAWHPHARKPNTFQRHGLGPETKWARQAPKNCELYLSGLITLQTPCDPEKFQQCARKAWLRLRYEYPEVVMGPSGEFADDGSAVIECKIPQDEREAEEWAERTLVFRTRPLGSEKMVLVDAGAMLSAEEMMREEDASDAVCLYLHQAVSETIDLEETMNPDWVMGEGFSFRVGHQMADGMGAYILAGDFLKFFAEQLGGRSEKKFDWGTASNNVPEPWVRMMNANQQTCGEEFEDNVKKNTHLVLETIKSEWGLRIKSSEPTELYTPRSIQKVFSAAESKTIMESIKATIGPTFSITHLGHAAMVMTALKFKSFQDRPSSNRFVSPLFINGRRYLNPKDQSKAYVPMCRAIAAIEFRTVERYILSKDASKEEIREKLKVACEEARRSYQAIREQKSLITESFSVAEFMATAKNEVKDKGMADPIFLSDGVVEHYTSRSYPDETGDRQILTVDDVRFTANPDGPPLIIRMCTFRDNLRVQAEWNGACYSEAEIRRFLDSIVHLMQIFT